MTSISLNDGVYKTTINDVFIILTINNKKCAILYDKHNELQLFYSLRRYRTRKDQLNIDKYLIDKNFNWSRGRAVEFALVLEQRVVSKETHIKTYFDSYPKNNMCLIG